MVRILDAVVLGDFFVTPRILVVSGGNIPKGVAPLNLVSDDFWPLLFFNLWQVGNDNLGLFDNYDFVVLCGWSDRLRLGLFFLSGRRKRRDLLLSLLALLLILRREQIES